MPFNCGYEIEIYSGRVKTFWENDKMLVIGIFSFFNSLCEGLFAQGLLTVHQTNPGSNDPSKGAF